VTRAPGVDVEILTAEHGQPVMPETDAVLALALLARWATRRAQRIAKERSQAAVCNGRRNRQLRPQDGEELT
jgi:hypothetical protein